MTKEEYLKLLESDEFAEAVRTAYDDAWRSADSFAVQQAIVAALKFVAERGF